MKLLKALTVANRFERWRGILSRRGHGDFEVPLISAHAGEFQFEVR